MFRGYIVWVVEGTAPSQLPGTCIPPTYPMCSPEPAIVRAFTVARWKLLLEVGLTFDWVQAEVAFFLKEPDQGLEENF